MRIIACMCLLFSVYSPSFLFAQHDIIFCGETIPANNAIISGKLMNVIRNQVRNINMPALRRRANAYFPMIEDYLQKNNLPEDLKYIPIVESGFQNLTSSAGASGFWQLMPVTARDAGLSVSEGGDDRADFDKSTRAACKTLVDYYRWIRNKYKISSWVLTAAAYNFGPGNIDKAIKNQHNNTDYFSLNLNLETASYVYKIIAVKELFEYPEYYMKDFGYNIFNALKAPANMQEAPADTTAFNSMTVDVSNNDSSDNGNPKSPNLTPKKVISVAANIVGKYKNFTDGQLISFQLQQDLIVKNTFNKKGNVITGTGWLIDDRIFINLGYEDHDVVVVSAETGKKGILPSELKKDELIILRVQADSN
ncbi:MAG TPA: lytic transglycosylase domain-containing protein [Parafilimonas sp.]|nr:lytic transglycosylase domain-containing protein [Parafilimonas sp.]